MEIGHLHRCSRVILGLAILVAYAGTAAIAQEAGSKGKPWYVSVSHYGKWVALASAIGLTTMAAIRHEDANTVFDGLNEICRSSSQNCILNAQGTYENQDAERLFRETKRLDGQANRFLLGGQLTLIASGAMFLIDLVLDEDKPENIPYTPLKVYNAPNKIGLGFEF